MNNIEIIKLLEDKEILIDDNWYFHATNNNLETIKSILNEGIKSASLLNKKGNNFNGKYFISLFKNTDEAQSLILWLKDRLKFVINDISPLYADRSKLNFRKNFINTRIPLRTSEWDGEYQQYLKIDRENIIALEYSLFNLISNPNYSNTKEDLLFLKSIILYLEEINSSLPIYDLSSSREINKQKLLTLNI